jgi:hypothetical protein
LAAKDARLTPAATPDWCVVAPQMIDGVRYLFWRNAANQTGGLVERLTPVLDNDLVTVYGIIDTQWPAVITTGDKPNLAYDIIVETPDQIDLVGVYEGRPPIGELVRFIQKRTVALYGKIEKKDGKTDIYRAPQ